MDSSLLSSSVATLQEQCLPLFVNPPHLAVYPSGLDPLPGFKPPAIASRHVLDSIAAETDLILLRQRLGQQPYCASPSPITEHPDVSWLLQQLFPPTVASIVLEYAAEQTLLSCGMRIEIPTPISTHPNETVVLNAFNHTFLMHKGRVGLEGEVSTRILDLETGQTSPCFPQSTSLLPRVASMAVLSNGRLVTSDFGDSDVALRVWNMETGHCEGVLVREDTASENGESTDFLPDDDEENEPTDASIDTDRSEDIELSNRHSYERLGLSMLSLPDHCLLTGSDHGRICLWDTATLSCVRSFSALLHEESIDTLIRIPDRQDLVVASCHSLNEWSRSCVRIWNFRSGQHLFSFPLYPGDASDFSMLDHTCLITRCWDTQTLRLYDLWSGRMLTLLQWPWSRALSMCVLAGSKVLFGTSDGVIVLWDPRTNSVRMSLQTSKDAAVGLIPLPDGRLVSVHAGPHRIKLWNGIQHIAACS